MRRSFLAAVCFIVSGPLLSQYYLRGEVRDQQGKLLPDVKIVLASKRNFPYYSGSAGGFGIPTPLKVDTITLKAEGYELVKTPVETTSFASFTLKPTEGKLNSSKVHLSSLTKNLLTYDPYVPLDNGETYATTVENEFVAAKEYPETGFALNVDRASYSNIRRFLNLKTKPPKDAVRIEEMLNYFNLRTKSKPSNETFTVNTRLTSCPWNSASQLLFINLQARKIDLEKTPPSNLVFLIDVSGSMEDTNRLPLLKNSFKLLIENLRSKDTVSIITYGSEVAVQLIPTGGDQKQKIIEAVEGLTPAGSTPGESAIRMAYKYASNTFIKGGNNRVILATDGDFNIGQRSDKELETLIAKQKETGIYLSCLGVGMGNYKDSKLETLAKRGNGNFAYLDSEKEAEKVLIEEFAQTVYTVANGVYLSVNFNHAVVKEYRLIGFDNPRNAIADSTVVLDGGEVGSGHSLLAVFEIVPKEKNTPTAGNDSENIAQLKLTYKNPATNIEENRTINAPLNYQPIQQVDSCLRFATSVIMFGGLLKDSKYFKDACWDDVRTVATSSIEANNLVQSQFLELVEKAEKLYPKKKKKG